MKKDKILLFSILFTFFLTFNVYAEKFILECRTKFKVTKNNTEPLKRYLFRYVFDLDNKQYTEPGLDGSNNIIVRENEFLEYFLTPSFGGGFTAQVIKWDRLNGQRKAFSKNMSVEKWKNFKKKLDKINSEIIDYSANLEWGDESYSVSKKGNDKQEFTKFEIIHNYVNLDEYALWECQKAEKAF